MEIISKKITQLHEYENNPRRSDEAVKAVAESIKEFGFKVPIVVDCNGTIVAGHTRYKAAKLLGMTEIPCIIADDLSEEQIKAFRLADNRTAELSEWDFDLLDMELSDIFEIDMERFGFDDDEVEEDSPKHNKYDSKNELNLYDRFIVPPFSTLDARKGQWQERKRAWKDLGLRSEVGRDEALLGKGLHDLAKNSASNLTGTSIFDPVLCEVIIKAEPYVSSAATDLSESVVDNFNPDVGIPVIRARKKVSRATMDNVRSMLLADNSVAAKNVSTAYTTNNVYNNGGGKIVHIDYHPEQKFDEPTSLRSMDEHNRRSARGMEKVIANA